MTSEYIHTKVCRICGRELRIGDFPSAPKNKDGHRNECRQCYSDIAQRRKNGEGHKVKHRVEVHPVKRIVCKKCGRELPEEAFIDEKGKRYYGGRCRECVEGDREKARISRNEYHKKYWLIKKERINERKRQQKEEKQRKLLAITCKDYCERYPCFQGIENIETIIAVKCHGYKPRTTT